MTKNTILYGMKDLKGAIGGVTLIKIDLVNIYDLLPSEFTA
jgi:hypothetical protein